MKCLDRLRINGLSQPQKMELGRIICQAYFAAGIKRALGRKTIIDEGLTLNVVTYPHFFEPSMDEIILEYAARNGFHPAEMPKKEKKTAPPPPKQIPPKRQRKRISEPVYSVKPTI